MKANKLRRLQKKKKKSDLVAAPNIQTSWWVTNPTELALVPWTCTIFHRFELSIIEKPHTHHKSFHRDGGHDQLSFSPTQPFLHPTVQLVTQIHWKLPWSRNSTSGLQSLGIREQYTRGRGMHISTVCLLSSSSTLSFHYEPLLGCLSQHKEAVHDVPSQTAKHIWMSHYTYDAATSGPHRGILLVSGCYVDMMSHFW